MAASSRSRASSRKPGGAAAEGTSRPLPHEHALANLDTERRGRARSGAGPRRTLREGPGWREEVLGELAEIFYEVRRFTLVHYGGWPIPRGTA